MKRKKKREETDCCALVRFTCDRHHISPHHRRPNLRNRSNINLLLTEREGRTGEYWPEVVAVRTERSEVRTKTTEGQYSPVRLELARLVSSLLYGIRTMLVLSLPAYDRFHGNGPYGEIPTKKEPIRTLGFTLPYNNYIYLRVSSET